MFRKRPLIIISNDDGYYSKGLSSLSGMLREVADLLVCAPEAPRSGFSCAFSALADLHLKLRHEEEGMEIWSCDGTPVDCVKMAFNELCGCSDVTRDDCPQAKGLSRLADGRKPDMVVGGINHGNNASVNAQYSGTMGVVLEGCMKFVPSVAFSLCDHDEDANFEPMADMVKKITLKVLEEGLPKLTCLNVNFPVVEGTYKGVRTCRMGVGQWSNEVVKCPHPRGFDYYWMVGEYTNIEPDAEDTDDWALTHGYVAITPTTIDLTAYKAIDIVKNWNL